VDGFSQTPVRDVETSATAVNRHLLLCIVEQVGRAGGIRVNRIESRSSAVTMALAACGLAAAVTLSGCGAGQISQTAGQEAAVNGTSATAGNVTLRNVHLRADQKTDYVQPGDEVELLFVASNESADTADKLTSITSDAGTVSLTGDTALPALDVLVVGEPDGQIAALEQTETSDAAKAMVDISKPITNGLTYNFTFTFEKAGQVTVPVPISAGESPRRDEGGTGGHGGGDTGGH
jgi:copper(I)-binding protein